MSKQVNVLVVSPDTRSERHFDAHITVPQLKEKLERITGIPARAQIVTLHDASAGAAGEVAADEDAGGRGSGLGAALATLEDSAGAAAGIAAYGVANGHVLKVADTRPPGVALAGQFTDVSQVEKFELSDKEYAERRDTVLTYKKVHKIGRFADPGDAGGVGATFPPSSTGAATETASNADLASSAAATAAALNIKAGQRCEIVLDSAGTLSGTSGVSVGAGEGGIGRRGTVRFVGLTTFGTGRGVWVGVEYDEPVGKNDGSVEGERYFTCKPKFGGFVRPDKVRVGDFPPLDLEEDLEM